MAGDQHIQDCEQVTTGINTIRPAIAEYKKRRFGTWFVLNGYIHIHLSYPWTRMAFRQPQVGRISGCGTRRIDRAVRTVVGVVTYNARIKQDAVSGRHGEGYNPSGGHICRHGKFGCKRMGRSQHEIAIGCVRRHSSVGQIVCRWIVRVMRITPGRHIVSRQCRKINEERCLGMCCIGSRRRRNMQGLAIGASGQNRHRNINCPRHHEEGSRYSETRCQ